MCQEPDLNWWHEDFQSSALPAELSRPFLMHHPHFTRGLGSMSIKIKGRRDITKSYPGPGISRSSKGRLCKFQYSYWYGPRIIQMEIPCSKMLICTCIIYITRPIKKFPIGSVCERVEWMRKITNFESLMKKKYS